MKHQLRGNPILFSPTQLRGCNNCFLSPASSTVPFHKRTVPISTKIPLSPTISSTSCPILHLTCRAQLLQEPSAFHILPFHSVLPLLDFRHHCFTKLPLTSSPVASMRSTLSSHLDLSAASDTVGLWTPQSPGFHLAWVSTVALHQAKCLGWLLPPQSLDPLSSLHSLSSRNLIHAHGLGVCL